MARHMGVLGSSGPGRARNDGVLGAMHDSTAARLSAMYGMGSPMATGPGMAYQDGSLGVVRKVVSPTRMSTNQCLQAYLNIKHALKSGRITRRKRNKALRALRDSGCRWSMVPRHLR